MPFCRTLPLQNTSYQQTRHLELNTMVQTDFVIARAVVEIFMCGFSTLMAGFLRFQLNNFAIKHDTTILITSFHLESIAHSNDVNFRYYKKLPKIEKISLL